MADDKLVDDKKPKKDTAELPAEPETLEEWWANDARRLNSISNAVRENPRYSVKTNEPEQPPALLEDGSLAGAGHDIERSEKEKLALENAAKEKPAEAEPDESKESSRFID